MSRQLQRPTKEQGRNGALGEIRTHDLCLRRAALYPLSYKRMVGECGLAGIQIAIPIGTGKTTQVISADPARGRGLRPESQSRITTLILVDKLGWAAIRKAGGAQTRLQPSCFVQSGGHSGCSP